MGWFIAEWLTVIFEKGKTVQYELQCMGHVEATTAAPRANGSQPTSRSDTCEWNSEVLDPEMDKQWPYPDTGPQSGSPGDKPHYIIA